MIAARETAVNTAPAEYDSRTVESARFEFTIEDLVDVGERLMSRSEVVRSIRRTAVITSALAFAIAVYLVSGALLPAFALPGRLILAAACGVVAWLKYPAVRRAFVRQKLASFWREKLKSDGPFSCEVELTGEGVTSRQFSTTTSFPWASVERIVEVPEGVEIWGRRSGLIVVRERAFATAEQKRRFVDYARASLVS
jgi:hypothetical protein